VQATHARRQMRLQHRGRRAALARRPVLRREGAV